MHGCHLVCAFILSSLRVIIDPLIRPSHRTTCNALAKELFDPVGDVVRIGLLNCEELLELLPYAAASVLDLPSHPERCKTHYVLFEACILPDPHQYDIAGFLNGTTKLPKRVTKVLQLSNPELRPWSDISEETQAHFAKRLGTIAKGRLPDLYCRIAFWAPDSGDPFMQYGLWPLIPAKLEVGYN